MKIERKRLVTAGGTLLCALGIGYFMQSAAEPPAPLSAPNVTVAGLGGAPATMNEPAAPTVELNEITLISAAPAKPDMPEPSALPQRPVVEAAFEQDPVVDTPPMEAQPEMACDYELTASPEAAAMVRLSLSAPCMLNERFTLHHNGMMLSEVTDEAGQSEFVVPALSENAVFIVAFSNGDGAVANSQVPALGLYDRAVVQWRGNDGMHIHALEFGAGYDSDGHVWADAARDLTAAASGTGGFITRHGAADLEDPLLAEVYTFPTGSIQRDGDVTLSVEAEVTQANCGRDIVAQSIQKTADGGLKTQDLVLAVPECNAVGDFLVLKNLLNDLKVAAK